MKLKLIRWAGLFGSLLTGGSMILAGSIETGVGIIAAALSSASVLTIER